MGRLAPAIVAATAGKKRFVAGAAVLTGGMTRLIAGKTAVTSSAGCLV